MRQQGEGGSEVTKEERGRREEREESGERKRGGVAIPS